MATTHIQIKLCIFLLECLHAPSHASSPQRTPSHMQLAMYDKSFSKQRYLFFYGQPSNIYNYGHTPINNYVDVVLWISEGHHYELKVPIPRPERCLRDICLPNPQLMVTTTKVYFGVDSRSSQLVKQVINPQQWVPILDRNLIQLPVINAQSKGLILLLCKQNRSARW